MKPNKPLQATPINREQAPINSIASWQPTAPSAVARKLWRDRWVLDGMEDSLFPGFVVALFLHPPQYCYKDGPRPCLSSRRLCTSPNQIAQHTLTGKD